jgi:hypothetical protein
VCEQDLGSADRSPGSPPGPQTRNRDQSDATRPGPLAQATFRYSLFFVSYILSGTDRHFSVLHNGCQVVERTSVAFERVLVQRLRTIPNLWAESIGSLKGHFGVERSTLCRVLVEVTGGPALESND